MKVKRTRLIHVLVVIIIVSCLCLFLYKYNNKYTHSGSQAISGVLFVSEGEMADTPIRFLWNGWTFYPGELLTPDTYKMRDISSAVSVKIGQYNNFSMGNAQTPIHGSGTYVLSLVLPETEQIYAMELPEIFSSYEFYVNDTLVASLGNNSKTDYEPETMTRLVTFKAEGSCRLMLSTTDYSHYYSGLIYPPSFGTPDAVSRTRDLRIYLSVSLVSILLLFALLSLWISIRVPQGKNISSLFVILCLCSAVFVSYPLVHSVIRVSGQIWYTIELVIAYLIPMLTIILHNRICGVDNVLRNLSGVFCLTFCMLTLAYGCFAYLLNSELVAIFSVAEIIYKICTTFYLLSVGFYAVIKGVSFSRGLFLGDIFYSCTLIWDYLLPAFEPIYGGWMSEWGSMFLSISVGAVLWNQISSGYLQSMIMEEKQFQMQKQLELQKEHYLQMEEKIEESRRQRHDFRQHLRTIASLCGNEKEQLSYINQITDLTEQSRSVSYCKNLPFDALLHYYASVAKHNNIEMEILIDSSATFAFDEVVFCSVMGNLIENALEACQRMQSGERHVLLQLRYQYKKHYILIENTFDGIIKKQNNQFLSSKRNALGIGTHSAGLMVRKLGGTIEFKTENNIFKVFVIV